MGRLRTTLLLALLSAAVCASDGLSDDAAGAPTPTLSERLAARLEAVEDRVEEKLELSVHARLVERSRTAAPGAFTTDGCSGGMSAGWAYLAGVIPAFKQRFGEHPPWEGCCIAHDRLYHRGGGTQNTPLASFRARKQADRALAACVVKLGQDTSVALGREMSLPAVEIEAAYTVVAELMYRAVRVGGRPCTRFPWRWGYGWPTCSTR